MVNKNIKGIIFAIVSALAFSLGGLLIKIIPISSLAIGSGRCIFSSLFFIVYFLITNKKPIINKSTIIGGILVFLNLTLFVLSNKLTSAANTVVLEYTAPIYIILYELIFKRQKPKTIDVVTVCAVAIGIILVLGNDLNKGNIIGDIIAFINGIIYAFVMMLNNFKDGDSNSSILFGHLSCALIGLPFLLSEKNINATIILYIVILGVFQSGLGYFCLSLSSKYCKPLTTSLVEYLEPILNPVWVALFYNEPLTTRSVIGILIVVISIAIYTIKKTDLN